MLAGGVVFLSIVSASVVTSSGSIAYLHENSSDPNSQTALIGLDYLFK